MSSSNPWHFSDEQQRFFLVQFEDGQEGVLKDSFITSNRPTEESILNGLTIPFGPDIIDHCILGDTVTFQESLLSPAKLLETQQKRCIVTYPAGVHISNFMSFWEFMVTFLDVTISMSFVN